MAPKSFQDIPPFKYKPHVAILTDICNEPDDEESLTRFLLTPTSSTTKTHAEKIHQIIDAYTLVIGNINSHVPPSRQYPSADSLHSVVRSGISGYGMEAARGPTSSGTELLIAAIDAIPQDNHIWVLLWGGANVLAQALLLVQTSRSEYEITSFISKLRVYAISDQDDAGPWIRRTFPTIFYIASIHAWNYYGHAAWSGISGDVLNTTDPGGPDTSLVSKDWIKKNVQIGEYGSVAYPDFAFIPEGDTPTFLSLIQNGLTDPEKPEWGGWGGRYGLTDVSGGSNHYGDTMDSVIGVDGKVHFSSQATIWRWREAYQGDFAARMQWTLSSKFEDGSHAPVAVVNGDGSLEALQVQTAPDGIVRLDASGSWSPDYEELTFRWTHYREPTATQMTVQFEVPELEFEDVSVPGGRKDEKVAVRIPGRDEGCAHPMDSSVIMKYGEKIYHLILEVVSGGKYPMRSYRRILVEVVDNEKGQDGIGRDK